MPACQTLTWLADMGAVYLDLCFCCLAMVQLEQVAGLQVDSSSAGGVLLQVPLQGFTADIKEVQLAVAQAQVHIQGREVFVLHQQPLVDIYCFLQEQMCHFIASQG